MGVGIEAVMGTPGVWSDRLLVSADVSVVEVPLISVGGGMGSFALVDTLRIAGVAADEIRVLGRDSSPWGNYVQLTAASQMALSERIRSDSASAPDCLWGFPGYAMREAMQASRARDAVASLARVLVEPVLTHSFTPRIRQVVSGMQREARRIGYAQMFAQGEVLSVRKRDAGGYFTLMVAPGTAQGALVAWHSRFVHLAVGYPGLRWLPDTQRYREKSQPHPRMVHAYEPHEHVYDGLARRPGTAVVRGAGIAASRMLQRMLDDREQGGAPTSIVHVLRSCVRGSHGPNAFLRRRGERGWAYQGFNWPKAAWGGQYQRRIAGAEPDERARLYDVLGGTTTVRRASWHRQLERARKAGAYRLIEGEVTAVHPRREGLEVTVTGEWGTEMIAADYIIDATGMDGDVRKHPLLADVLDHAGAMRNDAGRLCVNDTFEVLGARSGTGRLYASGPSTLGNSYAPVDTLLGMQYAALRIADDLAALGVGMHIGSRRSLHQWWRWARGVSP